MFSQCLRLQGQASALWISDSDLGDTQNRKHIQEFLEGFFDNVSLGSLPSRSFALPERSLFSPLIREGITYSFWHSLMSLKFPKDENLWKVPQLVFKSHEYKKWDSIAEPDHHWILVPNAKSLFSNDWTDSDTSDTGTFEFTVRLTVNIYYNISHHPSIAQLVKRRTVGSQCQLSLGRWFNSGFKEDL